MRYLFVFAFCTPQQWLNNETCGWDDEDSFAFFVEASDAKEAADWGTKVAEAYVRQLFEMAIWPGPIPSWQNSNFAHWIEDHPSKHFSEMVLGALPITYVAEMPNFEAWPKVKASGLIKNNNLHEH